MQFLNLSKECSDIKMINLASPVTPTEYAPIILLKTITNDDIQDMKNKNLKLESFVSRAIDVAKPILSQVGMIAIIIYTSRAKLAQFYAKFGEAAHSTFSSASLPSGQSASATVAPGGAPPASGVAHSASQDSKYTLGSESSDGLPFAAAAAVGAGATATASAHSMARAENEFAAAMEAAFEDLVDDMVVLAAATA